MQRAKSLLISESAFFGAATASVIDQERNYPSSSAGRAGLSRRYSSFNLSSESDNEPIIEVAKNFLSTACPELLTILESHYDQKSARDRLVKIGRNINATLRESSVHEI